MIVAGIETGSIITDPMFNKPPVNGVIEFGSEDHKWMAYYFSHFIEGGAGSSSPVSPANEGRIRYNEVLNQWEQSENGGPWVPLGGGPLACQWLRDAVAPAVLYPITAGDGIHLNDNAPIFFDTAKTLYLYSTGSATYLKRNAVGENNFIINPSGGLQYAQFTISDKVGSEQAFLGLYEPVSGYGVTFRFGAGAGTPGLFMNVGGTPYQFLDINRKFYTPANQGIEWNAGGVSVRTYYNASQLITQQSTAGVITDEILQSLTTLQRVGFTVSDSPALEYASLSLTEAVGGQNFYVGIGPGYPAGVRGINLCGLRIVDTNDRFYTKNLAGSGGLELNAGGASVLLVYNAVGTTAELNNSLSFTGGNGTYVRVPQMPQANRPAVPLAGMQILNTTTGQFEGYNGAAWVILG